VPQIEAVRQAKERALDEERTDLADELRAEERRLTQAWRLERESTQRRIRSRLGVGDSIGNTSGM
jgi:hypothetical protein